MKSTGSPLPDPLFSRMSALSSTPCLRCASVGPVKWQPPLATDAGGRRRQRIQALQTPVRARTAAWQLRCVSAARPGQARKLTQIGRPKQRSAGQAAQAAARFRWEAGTGRQHAWQCQPLPDGLGCLELSHGLADRRRAVRWRRARPEKVRGSSWSRQTEAVAGEQRARAPGG